MPGKYPAGSLADWDDYNRCHGGPSIAVKAVDELLTLAAQPVTPDNPGGLNLDGLNKGDTTATEAFVRRNYSGSMADAVIAELLRRFVTKAG
jgi:hypothetical protein